MMNKNFGKEVLLAHACCSYVNVENKLCMMCPWNNTENCTNTAITEELIIEAIHIMKGIKSMEKINLSEIKVTSAFTNSTPNPQKVQKYREYYEENQEQVKPILIDNNNVLRDGYIQYLILKDNGIEEAMIIRKKKYKKTKEYKPSTSYENIETTYIYGIHPNDKRKTERVWRVPASWKGWEKDLLPGDKILVRTKYGNAPIIITKIEWLNRCPVDVPVKKVVRRLLGDKDA